MSILECMVVMDFSVYVVKGVCRDMETHQDFACVALMQFGSSTVHWFLRILFLT